MSSKSSQSVNISEFGDRFRQAFGGKTNAEIARELNKTDAGIKNYVEGRVTLPLIIEVSRLTGCSIDWLLTGEGEKYLNSGKQVNLDETFRAVVREIVREEVLENSDFHEKIQGIILATQSNVGKFEAIKNSQKEKKAG